MDEYESLVEQLALKDQAPAALQALLDAGPAATPAVRRGLRHDEPVVRQVAGWYAPGGQAYRRLAQAAS